MVADTEAAIWERIIEPEITDWPPDAARAMLGLRFNETDHQRMDLLAAKAREGTLTEFEQREIKTYLKVSHLLALMQSKARRSLRLSGSAA